MENLTPTRFTEELERGWPPLRQLVEWGRCRYPKKTRILRKRSGDVDNEETRSATTRVHIRCVEKELQSAS